MVDNDNQFFMTSRLKLLNDAMDLAKNRILNFFENVPHKNIYLERKIEDLIDLHNLELFSKKFLFMKCIYDIITALEYYHSNYLTFQSEFNVKNIFFCVR